MERNLANALDRWLTTDPRDTYCPTCEDTGEIYENENTTRECPNCTDPTLAED